MGAPIARRLVDAGHSVAAWNRTAEKAAGLGATAVAGPGEALGGAELVITVLADGSAVDETMRAALATSRPVEGAVWLQSSTVGTEWTQRLASLAAGAGLAYVDAPVLGTRQPAEQGQLTVLAAGPEHVRPLLEHVLPAICRKLVWLGEKVGAASALKLVLNHWIMNTIENIAETVALAQALDVDPRKFLESISGGGMDMPYAHAKTDAILAGNFAPSFTLRMAAKDVGLILEAAEHSGLGLKLAEATNAQLTRAIGLGHGDDDVSATYYATRRD
jgi:3-hydroxyisobutyrate dehydrogenase